jgi:CubicO group peptidase (beta-lactamase class C family)
MHALEDALEKLVASRTIPGLTFASLRSGRMEPARMFGIRGSHDDAPVDTHTVFEAASLTKPVVSFMALQLVGEGLLNLHVPLFEICGDYVPDDPRARQITAFHVLSHTSGLPNIVREDAPLKTYFPPGERFSYGSSAFAWLQRAMQKLTGMSLEAMAQQRVFMPLGMLDSSLEWQGRFATNHAQGHEWEGEAVIKRRVMAAQASWSLLTTATDYLRFVQAVLGARGLTPEMHVRWFDPVVAVRQDEDPEDLAGASPPSEQVAWGLGWGLEPSQDCFFHWGHSPGFRAYVLGNRLTHDAVVWFANSARGLRLAHLLLPAAVPGEHPSVQWLQIGQL